MQKICGDHGKTFTWEVKTKQMGKKEAEAGGVLIGTTLSTHRALCRITIIASHTCFGGHMDVNC